LDALQEGSRNKGKQHQQYLCLCFKSSTNRKCRNQFRSLKRDRFSISELLRRNCSLQLFQIILQGPVASSVNVDFGRLILKIANLNESTIA